MCFEIKIICYSFFLYFVNAKNCTGMPLILTPYLENGDIVTARQLARVTCDICHVTSYSGYFTVNETCGNNLFFWFFPTISKWTQAPTVIWLQGGPGASSMYGLFKLIGPFDSFPDGLKPRNYSWTNFSNLLFIDNPVGAGFSFTTGGCYPTTIESVTLQLYSALEQFFKLFPELKFNKLYLTGESFAGHYIPALASYIDDKNKKTAKINLAGIVMGNPLMNLDCHDYGSYLYQLGIADDKLRDDLYTRQDQLKKHVKEGNFSAANDDWYYILNDLIYNRTDMPDRESITTGRVDLSNYMDYLNRTDVRNCIHVGSVNYTDMNWDAYNALNNTIAEPRSGDVEKLLRTKKYLVVFYSGMLDVICMYTSTVCILRGLEWEGRDEYLNKTRQIWYIRKQVVGWVKSSKNILWEFLIRDSGHAVPLYTPETVYRIMSSIISAEDKSKPMWNLDLAVSPKY